ncbi:MAG: type II toxin-antitoxin system VapC family toxin [Steroidobacteraceae bacterium]
MSFDLDAVLRGLKPQRKNRPLRVRPHDKLHWIEAVPLVGSPVLLDSTVYIDTLQGRSPAALDALVTLRTCNHSAVCLSELTHVFGRLSPADARTEGALKIIGQTIRDIPAHRLVAPDAQTWGAAGVLAGILFRLGSYSAGAEKKCLNDALIFLQGRKLGWPILTGNVKDFDLLNQLVPDGRILLYRRTE